MPPRLPQPHWMRDCRIGDVIARPHGAWRIVREVSRYQDGRLRSVTLVIRRCSWTRRCYTIINSTDLRILKYRRVARNAKLNRFEDKAIKLAIEQRCADRPFIVNCCEVEGIA